MTTTLETRSFEVRLADTEARTVSGIAVPWNTPADIAGIYTEQFERGSVTVPDSGKVLLYWRHSEPIGTIINHEDTDAGWEITARISQTTRGDEAYTLLRDGVISEFSIGFQPLEHREDDETGDVTRTRVLAKEVSLVPFGAYGANAAVAEVRTNTTTAPERSDPMTVPVTAADLAEVRESVEELSRSVTTFSVRESEPIADTRSAGEVLRAIVDGDEATIRSYQDMQERAYTGGTSADSIAKDGWVGDLTRIIDGSSGVLATVFSTGVLPDKGNNLEYGQLKSNSVAVAKQDAEGDDLGFGKVQLELKTTPVLTYGGYTQLTRQSIERSTLPILDRSLEALAVAAGARQKIELRSAYVTLHAARLAAAGVAVVLGATLAASTLINWTGTVIDAAIKLEAENLAIEHLVVSTSVFKKLSSFTGSDGRPLFVLDGNGVNTAGTLNLPGLTGSLAGVRVVADPGLTGDSAAFVVARAIRAYTGAAVSLSDENIVNLSKTFSVYRYGAVAPEVPAGIVPVKLAAA